MQFETALQSSLISPSVLNSKHLLTTSARHHLYFPTTYTQSASHSTSPLSNLFLKSFTHLINHRLRHHPRISNRTLQTSSHAHKTRRLNSQPLLLNQLLRIETPPILQILDLLLTVSSRDVRPLQRWWRRLRWLRRRRGWWRRW